MCQKCVCSPPTGGHIDVGSDSNNEDTGDTTSCDEDGFEPVGKLEVDKSASESSNSDGDPVAKQAHHSVGHW